MSGRVQCSQSRRALRVHYLGPANESTAVRVSSSRRASAAVGVRKMGVCGSRGDLKFRPPRSSSANLPFVCRCAARAACSRKSRLTSGTIITSARVNRKVTERGGRDSSESCLMIVPDHYNARSIMRPLCRTVKI